MEPAASRRPKAAVATGEVWWICRARSVSARVDTRRRLYKAILGDGTNQLIAHIFHYSFVSSLASGSGRSTGPPYP